MGQYMEISNMDSIRFRIMESGGGFSKQMEGPIHMVITTNTFEFSDKCIHLPGKEAKIKYLEQEEGPSFGMYYFKVFANGRRTKTDEGYVSIAFHSTFACLFHRGRFIISVIDAYGNQRFTKTFSFFNEHPSEGSAHSCTSQRRSFHMDRYICRERLLSEPDELLPNDVLTLLIDVRFVEIKSPELLECNNDAFKSSFQHDDADQPTKLLLDSPLADLLIKESHVFQNMLENPMEEKRTKTMKFDKEDYIAFNQVGGILKGDITIFNSVREIFDAYIIADRYCIPAVTATCAMFLKLCLFDHTTDEYFEIINEYEAEGLKELLINEIKWVKRTDFEKEIEKLKDGAIFRSPFRSCLWRYSRHQKDYPLSFQNVMEAHISHGNEAFDFYQ